jgi:hypothetical protein
MTSKMIIPVIVLFLFFSSLVTAQTNISLFDFRIPESQYKKMIIGLSGSTYGGRYSESSGTNSVDRRYSGSASIDNAAGFYSEAASFNYSLYMIGTQRYGAMENNYLNTNPLNVRRNEETENLNLNYAVQYSKYGIIDQAYYFIGSNGSGTYGLSHQDYTEDGVEKSNYFYKQRQYSASLSGGIGFGRIRNAHSVIVVIRILENLNDDGILERELSEDEIWELVELYESAQVINIEHQRPSKYIVRIIFEALTDKGLIRADVSTSYSSSRTIEVFQEQIYPRLTGWTVQVGPSISRTGFGSWDSNTEKSLTAITGNYIVISGFYGYPLTLNLHSITNASIALPIYGNQKRVNYYVGTELYYEISERISTSLGVQYIRSNTTHSSNYSIDSRQFSYYLSSDIEINYYIEDNISLYIRGTFNDYSYRTERDNFGYRSVSYNDRLDFGVSYKIL